MGERRGWRDGGGETRRDTLAKNIFFLRGFGRTRDRRDREEAARWPSLRSKMGLLKSSCLELAEVRVEGGKGHQRHGWVLESLVRHQGRPKGTSTGGGDPPRDGNALSEREPNSLLLLIIKCFDLSLSWFLEVPRADLSVPPHLLPSTPPAFVSYTVYKVYLGLVLLSVHALTSLEEDHGYVSVDLPKSRKGE